MTKYLVTSFILFNETIQDVLASQQEVFLWMYRVVLGLSLLLSILVLLTYFFFKNEFPYSIPMFFNIAVFMLTFSLSISAISPEWVVSNKVPCYIQAIGIQFSGTSVICWYTIVSLSLLVVVEKKSMKMLLSYQIWIHSYCWGLPFILTIIPVALQEIGAVDYNIRCWIMSKPPLPPFLLELLFFYILMGISSLACIVLWFRVIYKLIRLSIQNRHIGKFSLCNISFHVLRHVIFVIFFAIMFLIMFIHRILLVTAADFIKPAELYLKIPFVIVMCGCGIWTFMSFGVTQRNIKLWKDALCCCCRQNRRNNNDEFTETSEYYVNGDITLQVPNNNNNNRESDMI